MKYRESISKIIKSKKEILGIKNKIDSIKISNLAMGENNNNFLIIINNKFKFVFRIGLHSWSKKNMKYEFNSLKKLPPGIGPKAFYFDNSYKFIKEPYLILSYIEGKHIKLWTKKRLKLHAETISILHNKRYNISLNRKKFSLYKRLLNEIKGYTQQEFEDKNIKLLMPMVKNYIKTNDFLFTQLTSFSKAHTDLCLLNILFKSNKFYYIDWEYSKIEDNAYDLAKLYFTNIAVKPWSIKLNKQRENFFINQYLNSIKFKDNTLKKRIHLWHIYILLTDSLYCLWKLNNFDKENSAFPKTVYQRSLNLMINSLKKKFLKKTNKKQNKA